MQSSNCGPAGTLLARQVELPSAYADGVTSLIVKMLGGKDRSVKVAVL